MAIRLRDNALAVAEWLSNHDEVTWVSYAGLPGDRYYNLARRYVPKGAGAVLTFGVRGGHDARPIPPEGRTSDTDRHRPQARRSLSPHHGR